MGKSDKRQKRPGGTAARAASKMAARWSVRAGGVFLVLAAFGVTWWYGSDRGGGSDPGTEQPATTGKPTARGIDESEIAALIQSEELILDLTPELVKLNKGAFNLRLPGSRAVGLFADRVLITDIDTADPEALRDQGENFSIPGLTRYGWPIASRTREESAQTLSLWGPFLDRVEYFDQVKFYLVRGEFTSKKRKLFDAEMAFEGLARCRDGYWRSVVSKQHVFWAKKGREWRITEWRQASFEVSESKKLLFREVLIDVLSEPREYLRSLHCQHQKNIVDLFKEGKFGLQSRLYAKYIDFDSVYQHPGLSVVDIDGDGHDELYVMARWGKNLLFRNRGDGTFVDVAADFGLDIDGLCNGANFADYDNDGDLDAFIGRSLERSMFLLNEGGKFVDRPDLVSVSLPFVVSSVSSADFNGDGLLDVYLSTYGPTSKETPLEMWTGDFLSPDMAREVLARKKDSHRYLNLLGPPNWLLINEGGKFSLAPAHEALRQFHNTYQATWADYDQDGDPDVYVCNDFAPDALYRNERDASGNTRFVDVSRELAGEEMMGFGMGASWGDYDNDGREDLYVSNMFSKAGTRITAQFRGLDSRIPHSAKGSLLFHNQGEKFAQVAGLKTPALTVAKVGWSFGGQFVDVDNDGFLDVYSASGFYTAPKEIASQDDL